MFQEASHPILHDNNCPSGELSPEHGQGLTPTPEQAAHEPRGSHSNISAISASRGVAARSAPLACAPAAPEMLRSHGPQSTRTPTPLPRSCLSRGSQATVDGGRMHPRRPLPMRPNKRCTLPLFEAGFASIGLLDRALLPLPAPVTRFQTLNQHTNGTEAAGHSLPNRSPAGGAWCTREGPHAWLRRTAGPKGRRKALSMTNTACMAGAAAHGLTCYTKCRSGQCEEAQPGTPAPSVSEKRFF